MVYSRGARGESSVESGDLGAELGDALEAHLAARAQRLGEQAHPQLLHHPTCLLQQGLALRVAGSEAALVRALSTTSWAWETWKDRAASWEAADGDEDAFSTRIASARR